MSEAYLVETQSPEYKGMVAGVSFKEGQAILTAEIAKGTDRTLEQLIWIFRDLGYTVSEAFACEECGRVFESQKALNGHMKSHRKSP